jgi:hypothetical protein
MYQVTPQSEDFSEDTLLVASRAALHSMHATAAAWRMLHKEKGQMQLWMPPHYFRSFALLQQGLEAPHHTAYR